jgi:hypothetical protein
MADEIATGPYVIRNRGTGQVIEIEKSEEWAVQGEIALRVGERDEVAQRDRQIWWVEPIPGVQDSTTREDGMFMITNIASGKGFSVSLPDLVCQDDSGRPSQTWILSRVVEDKEG